VGFKVTAFLFPLSRIDGQSLPRGRRFTSASEGQEFHLHENQVINDLIGLCSSSLTTRVISRKRIALTRGEARLSARLPPRAAPADNRLAARPSPITRRSPRRSPDLSLIRRKAVRTSRGRPRSRLRLRRRRR